MTNTTEAPLPPEEIEQPWVVLYEQHPNPLWWGKNQSGYTADLLLAGMYSKAEAEQIARASDRGDEAYSLPEALRRLPLDRGAEAKSPVVRDFLLDQLRARSAAPRTEDSERLDAIDVGDFDEDRKHRKYELRREIRRLRGLLVTGKDTERFDFWTKHNDASASRTPLSPASLPFDQPLKP